ncbi:MAG: hypothetical protein KatS3mg021_0607 [Fimbriimonadales bacterium]|nr:MAG: hypothetical protein KatS3mg021_0607 [Fimbriimonadales bacterium]
MKLTTRLIALLWLGIGSLTLFQAFQGVQMPLSLKFFATLQVLGALALLGGLVFGYVILITMSAFTMVTGIFALIAVPFMPAEVLERAPSVLGLPPRGGDGRDGARRDCAGASVLARLAPRPA